jgi:hypothetical protein
MSVRAICGLQIVVIPDENVFCLEVGLTGKLHGEVLGAEDGSLLAGLQCLPVVRMTLFVGSKKLVHEHVTSNS